MRHALLWLLAMFAACECAAQSPAKPLDLVATPNRPTVTNTADTTQLGVVELEFGVASATWQQSLQGLLKFGVLPDLELQWGGSPWQHDATHHAAGVTDNDLGFRWRFLHQGKHRPTLSIQYNAKVPSAGPVLGTGRQDHIFTLLASKDLPAQFHVDTNLNYQILGRPAGGFAHNWFPDVSISRQVTGKWGLSAEVSGNTRGGDVVPAVIQHLWAVNYNARPRLILDAAVQFRVTGPVPSVVYLAGFTYSIADLYHRHR